MGHRDRCRCRYHHRRYRRTRCKKFLGSKSGLGCIFAIQNRNMSFSVPETTTRIRAFQSHQTTSSPLVLPKLRHAPKVDRGRLWSRSWWRCDSRRQTTRGLVASRDDRRVRGTELQSLSDVADVADIAAVDKVILAAPAVDAGCALKQTTVLQASCCTGLQASTVHTSDCNN